MQKAGCKAAIFCSKNTCSDNPPTAGWYNILYWGMASEQIILASCTWQPKTTYYGVFNLDETAPTITWREVVTKSDLWPQSSGTEITAGTDMQTITTPGHYCCGNNGVAASLKNCPMSDAFTLVVYRAAGGSGDNIYYVAQEYTSYLCNRRVIQTYNKDSKKWTTHEIQFKS